MSDYLHATSDFTPSEYPSFPDDLPTASLQTFDASDLDSVHQDGSSPTRTNKADQILQSCQTDGCFYLNLAAASEDMSSSTPTTTASKSNCSTGTGNSLMKDAESIMHLLQPMFQMSEEEKASYSPVADPLALFGYKRTGATVVDDLDTPDCAEFFNISKNDIISSGQQSATIQPGPAGSSSPGPEPEPEPEPEPASHNDNDILLPPVILDHQDQIREFMLKCHELCLLLLDRISAIYEEFPAETLRSMHRFDKQSGDHLRVIRGPARLNFSGEECQSQIHTPTHHDFGTLTILFNWLAGLQIVKQQEDGSGGTGIGTGPNNATGAGTNTGGAGGADIYKWIKPIPGHAIVLVGSALGRFTSTDSSSDLGPKLKRGHDEEGGELRWPCHPVKHRVVSAPGKQGLFPRYALGYFLRPEDDVLIRPLKNAGTSSTTSSSRSANGNGGGGGTRTQPGVLLQPEQQPQPLQRPISQVTPTMVDDEGEEVVLTAKDWIRSQARGLGIGRE
ncbi:hypothetical protein ABEF95_001829 [Exophiala dermatitidis]